MPVERPTVTLEILLELHVPPIVVLVSVVEVPLQIVVVPAMLATDGLTVAVIVVKQPGDVVKVIFAVPALTPVSKPDAACTFAIELLLLIQVPPDTGLIKVAFV